MKIFILSLFVAAAFAAPAPLDEETGEPVELIVNGVSEGEALEIGEVLGIKVKEHVEGQIVSSTDLLYPLTAAGLQEAAAVDASQPSEVIVVENPEAVEIKPDPVQVVDLPHVVENQPESVDLSPPVLPGLVPLPPINIPALLPEIIEIPESVPEIGAVPLPPINIPALLPENIEIPESVPEIGAVPLPPINIPALLPENIEIPVSLPEIVEVPAESLPEPAAQHPTGEVFNDGTVQVTVNAPGVLTTVQSWFNMVLNYFNGNVQTTHQIV